jgi:Leucine-rich repeat (LRR) protein
MGTEGGKKTEEETPQTELLPKSSEKDIGESS